MLDAEVGPEGVADAVLEHLARGVRAGRGVADATRNGGEFRVHGVRREAHGIEEGLSDQPLNGPCAEVALSHGAPFEAGDSGPPGVDAPESQVEKPVSGIAPHPKRVFDEVLEILLENGHVEEAFPLAFLPEPEALLEANLHVGGGFWPDVEGREDVDAAHFGLDEFLGDAGEAEPLAHAGPEVAGLSESVVQTGAEDGASNGDAVERELLVAAAQRYVEAFVGLDFGLQVGGHIGGVVDRVSRARGVEFRDAAGALGVDPAGGGPEFATVLGPGFPLPGARRIGLSIVVVIDQPQEAPLHPVVPRTDGMLEVRIDGDHPLGGAGVRTRCGRVETGVGIEPDERADALAADGIGPQAISPAPVFRGMLPCAVDAPLPFRVVMVHGEGVVGAVMGLTSGGVDLGPFVPVAAQPLSPEADAVAVVEPAGVQPRGAALHEGAVPVLPAIARIAVHAVLDRDAGEGFRVGEGGAELDDATQCRGAIQHAAGALDHFDLFKVFEGEESPCGPAGIATEDGQTVEEDGDPGTGAEAVSTAAPDLGLAVDDGHARGAGQALVCAGRRALVDEFRGKDVDGHADLTEVLFIASSRDDGGPDAGHVGLEGNVKGPRSGPRFEGVRPFHIADVPNPQRNRAMTREGELAVQIGEDALAIGEDGGPRQGRAIQGIAHGAGQRTIVLSGNG